MLFAWPGDRLAPNRLRVLADGDGLSIVTSEWLVGAFTALGALIGSGATLASGLIGNRTQRDLAAATRKAQIADTRRAVYGEYLTSVYSFMDRARELITQLENEAEMSECDVAHHAYCDDWERLQPTYAPVLIAGPGQIEETAETLRYQLGDLADKCDGWYTARKNGRPFRSREIEGVANAQLAAREARSEFASAARDRVYG